MRACKCGVNKTKRVIPKSTLVSKDVFEEKLCDFAQKAKEL